MDKITENHINHTVSWIILRKVRDADCCQNPIAGVWGRVGIMAESEEELKSFLMKVND